MRRARLQYMRLRSHIISRMPRRPFVEVSDQLAKRPVARWNYDKPHRCPDCHAVFTDKFNYWSISQCCECGLNIARFPRLWRILPWRGVVCEYHKS